jgi:hypothetical protein
MKLTVACCCHFCSDSLFSNIIFLLLLRRVALNYCFVCFRYSEHFLIPNKNKTKIQQRKRNRRLPKMFNLCLKSFKDIKWVIRICKSKKDRPDNGQQKKDKQRSTKHYPENWWSSNMNPTKNQGKGKGIKVNEQCCCLWLSLSQSLQK